MRIPLSSPVVDALRSHLEQAEKTVIFSHINPDGDSIGSALALKRVLEQYHFTATVVVPNEIPSFLQWLPGSKDALIATEDPERAKREIAGADLLFFVDFNELSRLGTLKETAANNTKAFRVLIDHHPGATIEVNLSISEVSSSSTAELMYVFLHAVFPDLEVSQDVAAALYTGIMTDTGGFSHNLKQPQTLKLAGTLLDTGIVHEEIHSRVYDNFSVSRMRLMGYTLHKKMKILRDCHTAYMVLTKEELASFNYQPGDTEGFVNLPLAIKGIRCTVLFLEKEAYIKLSLRSKGTFAVNKFSERYFNGGGHTNAAGGECRRSLKDTLLWFEQKIHEHAGEI